MCLNVIKVTLPRYGLLPPLTEDYLSFLNVRLESIVTTQQCHSCFLYIVMLNCNIEVLIALFLRIHSSGI